MLLFFAYSWKNESATIRISVIITMSKSIKTPWHIKANTLWRQGQGLFNPRDCENIGIILKLQQTNIPNTMFLQWSENNNKNSQFFFTALHEDLYQCAVKTQSVWGKHLYIYLNSKNLDTDKCFFSPNKMNQTLPIKLRKETKIVRQL